MDDRAALLRAAFDYCVYAKEDVRARIYSGFYARAPRGDPAWLELDARAGFLFNIQSDIALLSAEAWPTLDDLRSQLVEICRANSSARNASLEQAITEERERFTTYLERLTADDLHRVSAVPPERDLTPRESDRIWTRLGKHWGVERGKVWYPLVWPAPPSPPPNVLSFEAAWFAWNVPLVTLRSILKSCRVRRVWEVTESGFPDAKELDLAVFIPAGTETFWSSEKMDWMIYSSHESSVTVCGDWLLNLVKQAWPAWAEHLYHDYMYQRPPFGERPADG
jgi:hypothetical protein